MSIDTLLAVVGIGLTVMFGVLALVFAPKILKRTNRQMQRVDRNGVGIQAGRDVNIGGRE